MKRSHPVTALLLGLCLGSSSWAAAPAPSTNAPTLKLFPTTVLDDIRQTGEAAQLMETGLQDIIGRLDEQKQLYDASQCQGAEGDPGCAQLSKQLGATYLEMLDVMAEQLPTMEASVNNTYNSLQKRLRVELGRKLSPWAMQDLLLGKTPAASPASKTSKPKSRRLRLSDRFQKYYKLVASNGGAANPSVAVVAADIYLDMEEASTLIAQTREEINRARLMEQLNQSFGQLTPEMENVVSGVKSILFGEDEATYLPDAPPEAPTTVYRSPLELR